MAYPKITSKFVPVAGAAGKYTVDVHMKSDTAGYTVAGGNIRFWLDSSQFSKVLRFFNFAPGYGPMPPNPPGVFQGSVNFKSWFDFQGAPLYVNGAFQLTGTGPVLSKDEYVRMFSIELTPVKELVNPAIVWDLEKDPAKGSFLPTSEGIVLGTVELPRYVTEAVEHLNWHYIGDGTTIPYGHSTN